MTAKNRKTSRKTVPHPKSLSDTLPTHEVPESVGQGAQTPESDKWKALLEASPWSSDTALAANEGTPWLPLIQPTAVSQPIREESTFIEVKTPHESDVSLASQPESALPLISPLSSLLAAVTSEVNDAPPPEILGSSNSMMAAAEIHSVDDLDEGDLPKLANLVADSGGKPQPEPAVAELMGISLPTHERDPLNEEVAISQKVDIAPIDAETNPASPSDSEPPHGLEAIKIEGSVGLVQIPDWVKPGSEMEFLDKLLVADSRTEMAIEAVESSLPPSALYYGHKSSVIQITSEETLAAPPCVSIKEVPVESFYAGVFNLAKSAAHVTGDLVSNRENFSGIISDKGRLVMHSIKGKLASLSRFRRRRCSAIDDY
ncbi:hypothetical protein [Paramagnetospirillum magneticum]|uniref:hypothetical protein n=1 Tax=Paramagnetospirillum magneticum TaxID=84159 RepID=UPI0011D11B7D|nr:hypothetical protein [Paramagnetospirillum magneticum]